MPKCKKIKRNKRQVCIGEMDTEITLQDRAITPPVFGDPDFDENFTDTGIVWAAVNTVSGKTWFDGVNTDINITHEIYIYYDPTVTDQTWVLLNGRRIDILNFEDLEERNEFLKLTCTDKGPAAKQANKA